MAIKQEIIDELLKDYKNPEDLLGDDGIFKALKKALLERALSAELTDHLGYESHDPKGRKPGNSRNGYGKNRITGEDGEMSITVPRDRDASVVLTALMTRLFPCMPVVCLSVRYAVIWRSYTA
jgi:transposase-like protein